MLQRVKIFTSTTKKTSIRTSSNSQYSGSLNYLKGPIISKNNSFLHHSVREFYSGQGTQRNKLLFASSAASPSTFNFGGHNFPFFQFSTRTMASSALSAYPTGNQLNFTYTATDIEQLTDKLIDERKQTLDEIAQLKDGERTFENTFRKFSYETELSFAESSISLLQYVSPHKEVRTASANSGTKLGEFAVECGMRKDVYESLLSFSKSINLDEYSAQDRRVVKKTLQNFERNGLNLPKEQSDKLKSIKQEISKLCIEFQQNISEDTTKLEFTREDLSGLPASFIDNLKKTDDGKYIVSLQYPDLFPVMKYATNPQTRLTLGRANSSKCQQINTPILEKVVTLRREAAKLLGYKDHASYVLEIRMAKSPETVGKFLNELKEKLNPLATKELEVYRKLKSEESVTHNLPADDTVRAFDTLFLNRLNLEKNYQIDEEEIKQYFPLDVVTKGMLEVYEQILSLKFTKVENPITWHPDVQMFVVHDAISNEFVGQFYMDLFPREGKYGHACAIPLLGHHQKPDGTNQFPVAAMVTNFPKPTPEAPSLLPFSDVETYFHEFGHIMHGICSKTKYSQFAGTAVERDFVEAPSQMLENWCYEKEVLEKLSGHHTDLSKKLPENLIQKLIDAKNADTGILNLRQIFFATFDQLIHSFEGDSIDIQSIYHKTRRDVTTIEEIEGTNGAASFGHLTGGYDAQYYGYLYSQVFSADMYLEFKKHGVLSPVVGKRYRDIILSRGGEVDSMDSLIEFLGREPTIDAFLVSIGCAPEPSS